MHTIECKPSGAKCSCGKDFNIWKWPRTFGFNAHRMRPLAQGQARRHAELANAKEWASDIAVEEVEPWAPLPEWDEGVTLVPQQFSRAVEVRQYAADHTGGDIAEAIVLLVNTGLSQQ
jgi:hypothetical protein